VLVLAWEARVCCDFDFHSRRDGYRSELNEMGICRLSLARRPLSQAWIGIYAPRLIFELEAGKEVGICCRGCENSSWCKSSSPSLPGRQIISQSLQPSSRSRSMLKTSLSSSSFECEVRSLLPDPAPYCGSSVGPFSPAGYPPTNLEPVRD
jgi:hypothetical protein